MKRILLGIAIACLLTSFTFGEMKLKAGGSYGLLLKPDLSDIEDIPGASVSKGGIAFYAQGLMNKGELKYGIEIGYLRIYDFKWNLLGLFDIEAAIRSIPLLGIVQYDLKGGKEFSPYLQAGAGLYMSSVKATACYLDPWTGQYVKETATESANDFGFMIGGGGTIKLGETTSLDLGIKYYHIAMEGEACSTLNFGVALAFKL